jgi:Tol biopolymer transport system component/predicted Ser/Thr protein kinase
MPLAAGTRLGPYEVVAPLGAGGMGEVYRARDAKLERDVAIKILPEALARDPERLARFEREAKVLASLNHPNIAAIYGIEERALIMELVEGQTLARVKTPVALATALDYAGQIANALSAAHDKGITHRDLKPANVMVTPEGVIKVLDFGLAAQTRESGSGDVENSPTLTIGSTQAGVILGTAAYMSPEQASGQVVDRRSDIWSFGVVLLELLNGRRTFTGDTISHVLAAVLTKDPDWKSAPVEVQRLLRACLQKDVKQRLQSIGDWRHLVDDVGQGHALPSPTRGMALHHWVAEGVLAIALIGVSWMWWRASRPVDRPLVRVSVDLGPDAMYGNRMTAVISPDGTRIVFLVKGAGGTPMLATRLLSQTSATLLPGTENAFDPFFKPDGQWIGFFADGKLKKISVLGGAAMAICDAPSLRGGSWGEDDNIIFTPSGGAGIGLSRVSAAGGKIEPLTKPNDKGEQSHRWPQLLPGGKTVLFTGSTSNTSYDNASLEVLTLKTGAIKVLQSGGYFGRYLADGGTEGHLVYIHEGVLFGVPFDPDTLKVNGTPSPLLEDVAGDASTAGGQFDVSSTGTLVYRSGKATASTYPVVTLYSSGKTEPLVPAAGLYFTPRFSPDGKKLALSITAGKGTDLNVWDPQREAMTHLTFNGQDNFNPVWTPDGKHIVFRSLVNGATTILWIRSDGAGDAQPLYQSKNMTFPSSFSPDGRRLAFTEHFPETNVDLYTLPLDLTDPEHPKPGKPEKFWASPKADAVPMFSPDGHWIAYLSNEPGQFEIFVRPFPGPGGVWQVSVGGGQYPFWSRDGKQLFYLDTANRIFVVDYAAKGDTFTAGKPGPWSETPARTAGGSGLVPIDLAPDGKHFAIFPVPQAADEKGSVHMTFLFNFFDELRRRAEK